MKIKRAILAIICGISIVIWAVRQKNGEVSAHNATSDKLILYQMGDSIKTDSLKGKRWQFTSPTRNSNDTSHMAHYSSHRSHASHASHYDHWSHYSSPFSSDSTL